MRLRHRLTALLTVLGAAALTVLLPAAGASAAPSSPLPTDPAAHGYVGLCNQAGQNLTGGSVDDVPFVWKAVSTMRPPKAYLGRGQNAVLDIVQPRPNVGPAYWSGRALTATAFFKNSAVPTAQATYGDLSLREFIAAFPPEVDGLYVLRMQFGKLNYGIYSATYPTTTIQVTGTTWRVVSGGTVDCARGSAVSDEQVTGVVPKSQTVPRKPDARQIVVTSDRPRVIDTAPSSSHGDASHTTNGTGATSGTAAAHDQSPVADSQRAPVTDSTWILWLLVALVVVLAAALAITFGLHRPRASGSDPS